MLLLIHGIAISLSTHGQAKTVFHDVHFYESLVEVKEKISSHILSHKVVEIDPLSFSLAKNSESHLLCTNLRAKNGTLAQVVFTFADNKLHYIEARGNTFGSLMPLGKIRRLPL